MKLRELGQSGLKIAPLALGGNVFGWTVGEHRAFEILDAFVAAGGNCIDTADSYSRWVSGNRGGESESIIGKWLKQSGKRDQVVLATKVGSPMGRGKEGLSKKYILQACEDSLRRLQTDHIDLYQSHFDDPDTPQDETLEAYAKLAAQGKVIAVGASNFSPERLAEASIISRKRNYPQYASLQTLYNLYERSEYENTFEPFCRQHGLGVLTYYSLARGFLSGKYRTEQDLSKSPRGIMIGRLLDARGLRILQALDAVALRYKTNPATIALSWVMARPGVTAAISSATNLAQLRMLIESMRLEMGADLIEQLNAASAVDKSMAA